jgi:hypothetical protein
METEPHLPLSYNGNISCIVGIVDAHDAVHSIVVQQPKGPSDVLHEDSWGQTGRGKRWRWNWYDPWKIERSDIMESHLTEEDYDSIKHHIMKRIGEQ